MRKSRRHAGLPQPLWRVNGPPEKGIGPYYTVEPLSRLLKKFPLDDEGIPVTDWERLGFRGAYGKWRFVQATAQVALAAHAEACAGLSDEPRDTPAGQLFLRLAELMLNDAEPGPGGGYVWPAQHALRRYDLPEGWISGMTQGLVMSVLARARQWTERAEYAHACALAGRVLEIPRTAGGVRVDMPRGGLFFEEAPARKDYHILNHTVFALFGLYDAWRVLDDERLEALFRQGVKGVTASLADYDTGYWSLYENGSRPTLENHFRLASPAYHALHVAELDALYLVTGQEPFKRYAKRWAHYARGPFALAMKLAYRVFRWTMWTLKQTA